MKNKKTSGYIFNIILPVLVYGFVTGMLTAFVITLYKFFAGLIIDLSEKTYSALASALYFLPLAVLVVAMLSFCCSAIYSRFPDLKGGGIPTSIGLLRGLYPLKWLHNLLGIFFLSLVSFFVGVPLGNEGPSVQMGTAIGGCPLMTSHGKHKAWNRYLMTGGACAGFAVATGAPVSGIMFAVEEAHQRISPMIIMTAISSVTFATIGTVLFSPVFGVSTSLFPALPLPVLRVKQLWLPLVIGLALGLFAVLFLQYYALISSFLSKKLRHTHTSIKIFAVLVFTLVAGLISYDAVSTGHRLILSLLTEGLPFYALILLLAVRTTLTLSANSGGITGGIFLPLLALGALVSAVMAKLLINVCGLDRQYYAIIILLGITACIAGMMKMPLTALVFSIEALSLFDNILPVIIVTFVSFSVTEIFSAKSINDSVMETRLEALYGDAKPKVFDTFVTVTEGSFAVGKQIRDVLWPSNLFVLSVQKDESGKAEVDEHGDSSLKAGDRLHVRYSTYDQGSTKAELFAIVGEQEIVETAVRKV